MDAKRKVISKLYNSIRHIAEFEYPVKMTREEIDVQAKSWGVTTEDFIEALRELEQAGFAKIDHRNWDGLSRDDVVVVLRNIPHSYIDRLP